MIAIALTVYLFFTFIIMQMEERLPAWVQTDRTTLWVSDHIVFPLVRSAALIIFVILAYPQLFGLQNAPHFSEVLSADQTHWKGLINICFISGLFLPLLPRFQRIPALILPIQGALTITLLYYYVAQYLGVNVPLIPNFSACIMFFLTAAAGHWFAQHLSRQSHDPNTPLVREVYEATILIAQLPALLLYGSSLGSALNAALTSTIN